MDTKTYRIENNMITGFIDGLKSVRQTVEKILNTERFEYVIYSDDYGIELESLMGESFSLVEAEIERVITEALSIDDRIVGVTNFEFKKVGTDSASLKCDVETVFGTFIQEGRVQVYG